VDSGAICVGGFFTSGNEPTEACSLFIWVDNGGAAAGGVFGFPTVIGSCGTSIFDGGGAFVVIDFCSTLVSDAGTGGGVTGFVVVSGVVTGGLPCPTFGGVEGVFAVVASCATSFCSTVGANDGAEDDIPGFCSTFVTNVVGVGDVAAGFAVCGVDAGFCPTFGPDGRVGGVIAAVAVCVTAFCSTFCPNGGAGDALAGFAGGAGVCSTFGGVDGFTPAVTVCGVVAGFCPIFGADGVMGDVVTGFGVCFVVTGVCLTFGGVMDFVTGFDVCFVVTGACRTLVGVMDFVTGFDVCGVFAGVCRAPGGVVDFVTGFDVCGVVTSVCPTFGADDRTGDVGTGLAACFVVAGFCRTLGGVMDFMPTFDACFVVTGFCRTFG